LPFHEFLGKPGTWEAHNPIALGDALYFWVAEDSWQLWTSDGTAEGTMMVETDFRGGRVHTHDVVALDGALFFSITDGVGRTVLWRSDGTPEGTVSFREFLGMPLIWNSTGWVVPVLSDGALYFVADDGTHGRELWRSDGTPDGTLLVKDIKPGPEGSFSSASGSGDRLADVEGTLFLRLVDYTVSGTRSELWKSDGTAEGTTLLKEFHKPAGASGKVLSGVIGVNGKAFCFVETSGGGVAFQTLWTSDGTAEGTVPFREFLGQPTRWSTRPWHYPVSINGTMFFWADDGIHGRELWKSDGTPEGTLLLEDIRPGPESGGWGRLSYVNGTLFFVANDGVHGPELWTLNQDCNGNGLSDLEETASPAETDLNGNRIPDTCEKAFIRGDCDSDGTACSGVNDALTLLGWLFRSDTQPPCVAACDTDGNGEAELTDAVYGLDYCFTGTTPPPTPFPVCGRGTEAAVALACATAPESCQ
jgi:ELWxxDGT repeat protein